MWVLDGFANVSRSVGSRAFVGRMGDALRSCCRYTGQAWPGKIDPWRRRMTGEASRRCLPEQRLTHRDRLVRRGVCGRFSSLSSTQLTTADQERPRRPSVVVDPRNPAEERYDLCNLLLIQSRVGHQPPMHLLGIELRGVLEERAQISVAALLSDLGEIGRIIGALSKKRVAVHAVLAVPDILARAHVRGDELRIRELPELPVAIERQSEKDCGEEKGAGGKEHPRLSLSHSSPLGG